MLSEVREFCATRKEDMEDGGQQKDGVLFKRLPYRHGSRRLWRRRRRPDDLFVPGGGEDGGDLDADLSGTFSFNDTTDQVTFDQSADTFVRDMTFTAVRAGDGVQLEGEETFGETTARVVLRTVQVVLG
jgi:hypothetical protein